MTYEKRNLYVYACRKCGKPRRSTLKKDRAEEQLCRKCRTFKPDPGQKQMI